MKNMEVRTRLKRSRLFAAFTLLVVILTSGSLNQGLAQDSRDGAIGQVQQAVRERITSQEGGRDLLVRYNNDAQTEFKSNAQVRVRGTGDFSRNNEGKSRSFSYEAVINNRNRRVSDIKYDWRGNWDNSGGDSYVTNRLTGTYRLNQSRSDNPTTIAERVTRNLPGGEQQRLRNAVLRRLDSPDSLAIERRGRTITMASTRATQVSFEADGRDQTEQSRNGRKMRTKATLSGDRLVVSTDGDRSIDYQVTFEPKDNGRSLRVTRRISDEGLRQPIVAKSVYDKTSDRAALNVYTGDRNDYPPITADRGTFAVPEGTQLMAVLSNNLSTRQARDGERFTLIVRSPSQYDGATIEGHVLKVNRSGRVAGRAEMSLEFDRIQLRNGRATNFTGYIESVRTTNGETIRVDNEGRVQDERSQTGRTVTRAGIGAAIGAVIGAIAGGGKGAAIGAGVGAGAGAGSVIVQGRDDLDLMSGTEFTIRASAPR